MALASVFLITVPTTVAGARIGKFCICQWEMLGGIGIACSIRLHLLQPAYRLRS